MSRAILVMNNDELRQKASRWCLSAPDGTRVEFKETKRSIPQNAKMWAILTEISTQVPWHGVMLTPDDWKLIFMDALNSELRMVPNLDGNGFINLGRSTSKLSKGEMSDLMELIAAFGAKHNVIFNDMGNEG